MADCNKQIKHRVGIEQGKKELESLGNTLAQRQKAESPFGYILERRREGGKVGVGCMFHDPGEAKAAIFFYFLSILQETKSVDGQWRKQKNGTFQPFLHLFGFFVVGFVWLLCFFSQFSRS